MSKQIKHTHSRSRTVGWNRETSDTCTHSWKRSSSKPNDLYKSINANAMNTIGPFVGWNVQKQFFIAIPKSKWQIHTHNTSCTPYINSDKSDQLPKQLNKRWTKTSCVYLVIEWERASMEQQQCRSNQWKCNNDDDAFEYVAQWLNMCDGNPIYQCYQ